MEHRPASKEPVQWRDLGLAAGKTASFGMGLAIVSMLVFGDFTHVWQYLVTCILCSMVIGLGFHAMPDRFLEPANGMSPRKAVLLMQVKWLAICMVLLTISMALLKLIFGPVMLNNPISVILVSLIGLLITSLAVGQSTATTLVNRSRSLEQAQVRAGFLAIQAQLQPHTLFNALNTILALIRRSPDDAESATRCLAKLLRHTTMALEHEQWPLREEFDLLESLLELERLRFGERLRYELHLSEDLRDERVPPLLLIPLVENCLKHGFRRKIGPCRLSVNAEGHRIRVEDDGTGCPEPMVEGVGIRTVRERLVLLGGRITWPEVSSGFVVELELP